MATLTIAEKAPLIVTDSHGTVLNDTQFDGASSDDAIASVAGEIGRRVVVAHAVGTATITVEGSGSHAGQSGTIEVSVTDVPLTVELGTPEPK